jgi:hypothetical protein
MTRYLISFDAGAMTFPEEDLPDVDKAAHEVVQEAQAAGVWVFGGGKPEGERRGHRRDGHRRPVPGDQRGHRRVRGRRRVLTRGRAGVGCQDRRRVPLCAGGTGAPSRSDRLTEVDLRHQGKRRSRGLKPYLPPETTHRPERQPGDRGEYARSSAISVVSDRSIGPVGAPMILN